MNAIPIGPFHAVVLFERRPGEGFHAPRYLCKLTQVPELGAFVFEVQDSLQQSRVVFEEVLREKPAALKDKVRRRIQALHPDRFLEPLVFTPARDWHRFLEREAA